MPQRKSRGSRRERPRNRQERESTREIVHAIQELQLATQNKSVPAKPDVHYMESSKRPTIHTFHQTVVYPNVTATNTDSSQGILFRLSDFQNAAPLSALYDQYRIVSARVKFLPLVTKFGPSTTVSGFPALYTVIDHDNLPALTVTSASEYDTLQITPNQVYVERTLTPNPILPVESSSGIISGTVATSRTWFDMSAQNIPYYGVIWVTSATSVTGVYQLYSVSADIVLQCRAVR